MPTLSCKNIIESITIKNGDEKVKVIAVANSTLITEIKINIFIARKLNPLKQQRDKNFLFTFLKRELYSPEKKSRTSNGITAKKFLKTANLNTE